MNKEKQNFEKYTYLLGLNKQNFDTCVANLHKYGNMNSELDIDELLEVLHFSYNKENKEEQFDTIVAYFEIENLDFKTTFWIKKLIKFNGLANWSEYMKTKCMNNEAE